jgi:hypothetical protein
VTTTLELDAATWRVTLSPDGCSARRMSGRSMVGTARRPGEGNEALLARCADLIRHTERLIASDAMVRALVEGAPHARTLSN